MDGSEQQLKMYRLLVENSLGLMCIHDLDGVLLTINPAAAKSLGYRVEDGIGRCLKEFLAPPVQPLFDDYLQRIRTNPVDSGIMQLQAKDGTPRLWLYRNVRYEEPGAPVRVLGHAQDITELIAAERALRQSQVELARARDELETRVNERTAELVLAKERLESEVEQRRQMENELLRARKLEAIGGLAGGIAHDFNNLMTIVVGYCESLRGALTSNPQLYEQINQIYRAAEQANSLTRRLLAFSRRQILQPTLLNVNDLLADMAEMLRRLVSDDIELCLLTDSALGLIRADRGQIEQVLMNLVINASDAMPRGGKLTLRTENTVVEKPAPQIPPGVQSGTYVRLTVSDTGVGMDRDVKEHIFEPFFTTKDIGKGTGLGLATVYGVMKQTGGHIAVQSEPKQGTSFDLYFPQVRGTPALTGGLRPPAFEKPTRGAETVLVVDDQEGIRILLCETLRNHGYQVFSAANGREALRVFNQSGESIDLILTDMVMPEMGGYELAEALLGIQPQMRILYMTGYTDRDEDIQAVLSRGYAFIEKPFTPQALMQKMRTILDSAPGTFRPQSERQIRRTG